MAGEGKPIYSIDTGGLIHAWNRAYRPANFGKLWTQFDQLIAEGRLRASMEVFNEIRVKDDDLFDWCKERKDALFVEIEDGIQVAVAELMARYPRLVDTAKGKSSGDPFVIALAKTQEPAMIVVTEEKPGKVKIPDVCASENIPCIDLADMISAEGWTF